ncbi:metal ABC transporter permease [Zafaria sp. J156]|uniref:metal ABC transporter permease n=1 Tax=Zafaria sp. J156 TaxID=3116490 RepID=UPI002E77885B|nr:metal ABC transporter permease [Zafaria sp. J156]MEE1622892.1 metal ABC transporter permease [Zafaria sp. J156]
MMEALEFGFMQRALLASTIIAAVAPLVGSFIVQRRQALIGEGMGHVAFAGVGLAFLTGLDPLLGALALTLLAAVALVRLSRGSAGGDVSLALVFYGGLAAGYLFSARGGGGQNQILSLLFGSPLNLTWGQVATVAALATAVALALAFLYRQLVALAFDEAAARASGVPTTGLVMALTVLVALVVVAGMSTIGLLLISAMMVIPVATAAHIATSYRATLWLSSAIGAVSAAAGTLVSYHANVPTGSAIVLTALALYIGAAVTHAAARYLARRRHVRPGRPVDLVPDD